MYKLLDFYSDACRPCRMMDPIVESIISQVGSDVGLEKIDVVEESKRVRVHGVTAVPTFILLNEDGFEVGRKIGAIPAPTFRDWIKDHVS